MGKSIAFNRESYSSEEFCKRAIGIFDSGIGGLSAVRELAKILPNEDIVYFGGIGTPVNRLSELKVSFDNAGRAFSYRHFVGANRFVSSENTQPDVNIKKEEFNIRQCRCKTD